MFGDGVLCLIKIVPIPGCEGDLDVISVTILVARVNSADLADHVDIPFWCHHYMSLPKPVTMLDREDHCLGQGCRVNCTPLLGPPMSSQNSSHSIALFWFCLQNLLCVFHICWLESSESSSVTVTGNVDGLNLAYSDNMDSI